MLGLSSGTIGNVLETSSYNEIDRFCNAMMKPLAKDLTWGNLAAFGENELIGLKNCIFIYKRYMTNYFQQKIINYYYNYERKR